MAETMTYDPGTDTVTTEGNLTPDEQESLKVGEAMQEQQEQLLAGKYKDAADLEKAYIELQKKLGDSGEENNNTEAEQEEVLSEESEKDSQEMSEGATLITDASAEYYNNNNTLSKETIEKFYNMDTKQLVDSYMEAVGKQPEQPSVDISEASIAEIKNSVGGVKEYDNLVKWADQNLDAKAAAAFDSVVNSGNVQMIKLAAAGLKAEFENANGYEGRMLTGKGAQNSGDVYRSQPELVAAMNDPRYDSDPAYRQDVIEKLDRSDLSF